MFRRRPRFHQLTHLRGPLPLFGPAFVAAIAYVDPGNFATNIAAGSRFGYLLVWVLVLGNLMGMLVQYLSAKAGVATGRNLAELCSDHCSRPVTAGLWLQAELVAIATDLAEVLGGALALNLLFGLPLVVGGVITAVVAFGLLWLQSRGVRRFELTVGAFLVLILAGIGYCAVVGGLDLEAFGRGLQPRLAGVDSILLASGILGATVMPHVIYLHGAMTQDRFQARTTAQRQAVVRGQRIDVICAMTLAGVVNMAILVIAAETLIDPANPVVTIDGAHAALGAHLGGVVAVLFALALLASGLAASGVGTYSGQVVMQGFLRRRIPLLVRRAVTLAPALVVLGLGVDVTHALVLSQVVLSFGIPFALVPLVRFTRRRDIMGDLVNHRLTTASAWAVAALVIALNVVLIVLTAAA